MFVTGSLLYLLYNTGKIIIMDRIFAVINNYDYINS